MANVSMTFGSVLNSIGSAANMLTTSLDTVTQSVDMGAAWVQKAAFEQRVRYAGERNDIINKVGQELAMARSERDAEVAAYMAKSTFNAERYPANLEEILAAINAEIGVGTK